LRSQQIQKRRCAELVSALLHSQILGGCSD
jgi:hypothetical protein